MQTAPKLGTGIGGIVILETAHRPFLVEVAPEDGEIERARRRSTGCAIGAVMYDVAGLAPKVDSVMSRTELPPDVTPWLSTCPGWSWNFAGPSARCGTCRNTFRA